MDSKNQPFRVGTLYELETGQKANYSGLDSDGNYKFVWTNRRGIQIVLIKTPRMVTEEPPIPLYGSEVDNDGQTGGRKPRKTRKTRKTRKPRKTRKTRKNKTRISKQKYKY
jgi:hypothetical protein